MAVYPCDYGNHRYRQAQQSLYYTEIGDHVVTTYKVRLCPEHFTIVQELLLANLSDFESSPMASPVCEGCGDKRTFTAQARLFPNHADEQHLIADLCAACTSRLGNEGRLYSGEALQTTTRPSFDKG